MSRISCCCLCPRMCAVPRPATTPSAGRCAMPATAYVSKNMLHMWEEPPISGTRGAGAIFFSGCTLGCVYCQNYEISRGQCALAGRAVTAAGLAELMEQLEAQGAHNIELVTATQFVPEVIAALRLRPAKVPVVWNSSGYEREAVVDALAPYVDIWLPDYKYALSDLAERYSGAADYPETALRALLRMRSHQPEDVFEGDIMQKGMIVRHLVLPLGVRNSIAVLRLLAEKLPGTLVSLMGQYTPVPGLEGFPPLQRGITSHEYERVCDAAAELGLEGFAQELESSDSQYIPRWDM